MIFSSFLIVDGRMNEEWIVGIVVCRKVMVKVV